MIQISIVVSAHAKVVGLEGLVHETGAPNVHAQDAAMLFLSAQALLNGTVFMTSRVN